MTGQRITAREKLEFQKLLQNFIFTEALDKTLCSYITKLNVDWMYSSIV